MIGNNKPPAQNRPKLWRLDHSPGYTMIELLVALAITGLTAGVIYMSFAGQQKAHIMQTQTVELQQNLRAALDVMAQEIRMVGYDPTDSGLFGFQNLPNPNAPDYGRYTNENGICFYTDENGNGIVDASDSEQIAFRLNVDQSGNALTGENKDNVLRKYSCGAVHWQALAENIIALGFAYAYEGGSGWAIDTSSPPDGYLDLDLDTNHDGEVNELDNPAGVPLPASVPIDKIRTVKMWLLGRSEHQSKEYRDTKTYAVANQRITPNNHYVHRLVTATVNCRNSG